MTHPESTNDDNQAFRAAGMLDRQASAWRARFERERAMRRACKNNGQTASELIRRLAGMDRARSDEGIEQASAMHRTPQDLPALHRDIRQAATELARDVQGDAQSSERRRLMFEAYYGVSAQASSSRRQSATFQDVARRFGVTRQAVHAAVLRMLPADDHPLRRERPSGFALLAAALSRQQMHAVTELLGGVSLRKAARFYRDVHDLHLPIEQAVTLRPAAVNRLRQIIADLSDNNGAAGVADIATAIKLPVEEVTGLLDKALGEEAALQAQAIHQARSATLDGVREIARGWYASQSLRELPRRNRFINTTLKLLEAARLDGVQSLPLDLITQAAYRTPSASTRRGSASLRVMLPSEVARLVLLHYGGGWFVLMGKDGGTLVSLDERRLQQDSLPARLTDCERAAVLMLHRHGGRMAYRDLLDSLVQAGFGPALASKVLQSSAPLRIVSRAIRGFAWDAAAAVGHDGQRGVEHGLAP